MKGLSFVVFIFLLCGSVFSSDRKSDFEKLGFKGKVKEQICVNYKYTGGKEGEIDSKVVTAFNENGYISEEKFMNASNVLVQKTVYKYDTQNYLMEKDLFNSDETLAEQHYFTYGNNGMNIKDTVVKADKTTSMNNYVYDYKGNIIKSNNINIDYIYDGKNRITNEYIKKTYLKIYQYNDKGKISTELVTLIGQTEDVNLAINYIYDDWGRISEIDTINKGNPKENRIETYSYNTRGNLIEYKKTASDLKTPIELSKYTYNFWDTFAVPVSETATNYYENINYYISKVQASLLLLQWINILTTLII